MKSRTTQLIWCLVMILGLVIYWTERQRSQVHREFPASSYLFEGFTAESVQAIDMEWPDSKKLRVEKRGESWAMVQPTSYPARTPAIVEWLDQISQWRHLSYIAQSEVERLPEGFGSFGLNPAQFMITLTRTNNLAPLRFQVGDLSVFGKRRYLKVDGQEGISLIDASLASDFPLLPDDWRDRALLVLDGQNYDRLTISRPDKSPIIFSRTHSTSPWQMTSPLETRANSPLVSTLFQVLQRAGVSRFVSDENLPGDLYGLTTPDLELEVGAGNRSLARLRFGKSPVDDPSMVYVHRSSHSNTVLVVKELADYFRLPFSHFRDRRLIGLTPTQITHWEVTGPKGFQLNQQADGTWINANPEEGSDAMMDSELISKSIQDLCALEIVEFVKDVVTDFSEYGFSEPERRYRIQGRVNGQVITEELAFGKTDLDKIMVQRLQDPSVFAVRLGDVLRLPKQGFELTERKLWDIPPEKIQSILLFNKDQHKSVSRKDKLQWIRDESDEEVDLLVSGALDEIAFRLGSLKAEAWVMQAEELPASLGFQEIDTRIEISLVGQDESMNKKIYFGKLSPNYEPYAAIKKGDLYWVFRFPSVLFAYLQEHLAEQPWIVTAPRTAPPLPESSEPAEPGEELTPPDEP